MRVINSTLLKLILACALLLSFSQHGYGDENEIICAPVEEKLTHYFLSHYLYHFEDTSKTLQTPWASNKNLPFKRLPNKGSHHSFGTNPSAHWLRFCLENTASETIDVVTAFGPALAQEFDFIPMQGPERIYRTGDARPFSERDINHPQYHFDVSLAAGESKTFYLRLTASQNAFITSDLWHKDKYQLYKDNFELSYGVFTGVFLGLILYNLMLFFSIRQASSLWYIAFATSAFFILAFFNGRMRQYVLPDSPELSYNLLMICYASVSILGAMYSRSYLKLHNYPIVDRAGLLILMAFSIPLLITFFVSRPYFLAINAIFGMVVILYYCLFAAIYALRNGSTQAKYYLVALAPLSMSFFEESFYNIGLIRTMWEPYTPTTGLAATMILLAFGLGRTLIDDRRRAEQEALKQSEISNKLKSNYNEALQTEIFEQTSEITLMNQSLTRQAEQLISLDHLKSSFFANISHEFRTPLTLIQGPLNLLLEKPNFTEKDKVENVLRHTKSLQQLIDQILSLSAFESDSAQLKAAEVDLTRLLRFLVAQFSSYAEQHQIELKFHPPVTVLNVYVDAEKLQIVVNNLLNNALKFTPAGGTIDVELKQFLVTESNKEVALITVTDSGYGIDEADLPFVFDRYYQTKNPKGSPSGSGIGLALVKEIVNLHGGRAAVSSIDNVGSRFVLSLPLGSDHLHPTEIVDSTYFQDNSPSPQTHTQLSESSFEGIDKEKPNTSAQQTLSPDKTPSKEKESQSKLPNQTVLVVDDNTDMRDYLTQLLAPNYQIIEAADGEEAEKLAQQHIPQIIITDLMMPKVDGLELVRRLKSNVDTSLIPIIMLTAKTEQHDKLAVLQAEADDYLAKPFDARELKARIRNLLLKHHALKSASKVQEESEGIQLNTFMTKLHHVIENNLHDESFGVETLASLMFVSAPTLRRRLAAQSSHSPSSIIRSLRLVRARALVQEGNLRSSSELASKVGFSQASHFTQLYKKTYNEEPFPKNDH